MEVVELDFVSNGTGLPDGSADHALLFNILHIEDPAGLPREAHRVLKPGGTTVAIHWRRDIDTPRGPLLEIRPSSAQCADWGRLAGFLPAAGVDLGTAGPWLFGLIPPRDQRRRHPNPQALGPLRLANFWFFANSRGMDVGLSVAPDTLKLRTNKQPEDHTDGPVRVYCPAGRLGRLWRRG